MYKFIPILKSMLWGGDRIAPYKGIATTQQRIGESWELSGVAGNVSVVAEGPDAGMTLEELLAREKERLLGRKNFERFGCTFPLLVKFIDARRDLSIQVHPDDELARKRHNTNGKSEMWYVIAAAEGARLYSGFRRATTPEAYEASVAADTLTELLADHPIAPGDVFYLPAGRIHSLGAGALVAEIQQTSDLTYRIYDYNRRDADGNLRELHTELAREAIDYSAEADYRTRYERRKECETELVACPHFRTSLLDLTRRHTLDLSATDSFLVAICVEGRGTLVDDQGRRMPLHQGETVLVPASARTIEIVPENAIKLLTSRID
ncbi:MAG: class I mannose-6-phosphate isomerase [Alistipes sp.]|nr:class I mannose-6-phosphate isomerase [Alistipes sp.]